MKAVYLSDLLLETRLDRSNIKPSQNYRTIYGF